MEIRNPTAMSSIVLILMLSPPKDFKPHSPEKLHFF